MTKIESIIIGRMKINKSLNTILMYCKMSKIFDSNIVKSVLKLSIGSLITNEF